MKRLFSLRAMANGTVIAALATTLSFAVAILGIGNVYYASVFIPFATLACLAVSWFSFLRDDGLARRHSDDGAVTVEPRPAEPVSVSGLGADAGVPAPVMAGGGLDASMYAPRDGSIVERRPGNASMGTRRGAFEGAGGRAALAWAAFELAALAAVLYSAAGIGARFYH